MTSKDRALLLSVHPRFAEPIVDGTKLAEVRRQRPDAQPGTLVIIYATRPVGAVIGAAQLVDISQGTPAHIWTQHNAELRLNRAEFDRYLAGAAVGYVLRLSGAWRLDEPLALSEMRATADFHPPRSYRYLTGGMLHRLVNGHPSGGSLLKMLPVTNSIFGRDEL